MTTYAVHNSKGKLMMRFKTLIGATNYKDKMSIMLDDDMVIIIELDMAA